MPLYEYRCEGCSRTLEVIQKFSDKPLRKCTHCGGKLRKLVSASGFVLKGSGWYVTDYKGTSKGGGKPAAGDDSGSPPEAPSGGSEPAAPEAKPAAKGRKRGKA